MGKKIVFFVSLLSVLFFQSVSFAALDQIIVWDKGRQGFSLQPTQVATFSAYTWDSTVGHSNPVNTIEVISVDNLEGSDVGTYTTKAYGGGGTTYTDLDIILIAGAAGKYRFNLRASDSTNTVTASFVVSILGSADTIEVSSVEIVPSTYRMRESSTKEFDAIAYDKNGNALSTSQAIFTWVTPEASFGRLSGFDTTNYSERDFYAASISAGEVAGRLIVYAKTATQATPISAEAALTVVDSSIWDLNPPVFGKVKISPSDSQSMSKKQEKVFVAYFADRDYGLLYATSEAWQAFWQVGNNAGDANNITPSLAVFDGNPELNNIYSKVNFIAASIDIRGSLKAIFVLSDNQGNVKERRESDTVYITVGAGGGQPEAKVEGTILTSPSVVTNPLAGTTLTQSVGPYAAGTTIYGALVQYQLNRDADVQIYIFDLSGRQVFTQSASSSSEGGKTGYNYINWNCKYPDGSVVANGVYVLKVVSGGKTLASGRITVFQ